MRDILPGIVAAPRLAADPDVEIMDNLVRWLGSTGAIVAGPFAPFASAAFASRDLSVYGACRLCLVDIQGRGIQGACSTPPEPGLKVRTQTEEIREIRKIAIELLLANHDQQCPTCPKSSSCQLQDVARKLGIRKVRFKPVD